MKKKIVIANFSQNHNMAFYDNIMAQVADLDIGLAVLNAGVAHSGKEFLRMPSEQLQEMIDTNAY